MASEYNQTGHGYSGPGSYPHTTFYQQNGRYARTNLASPVTVNFPQAAYHHVHHDAGAVDFADFISQLTQMILAMVMIPVYMMQTVAIALFSVVKVAFWVLRLVIRLVLLYLLVRWAVEKFVPQCSFFEDPLQYRLCRPNPWRDCWFNAQCDAEPLWWQVPEPTAISVCIVLMVLLVL
ncbi:hypothetical protein KCU88_g5346, partial [Aureobasidium melanogenum]